MVTSIRDKAMKMALKKCLKVSDKKATGTRQINTALGCGKDPLPVVKKKEKNGSSMDTLKCSKELKPVLEWGKPHQCMGTKKTAVLPAVLNDLRIGLNAELFATMVTGGNALDKNGKQLALSDEAV